MKERWNLNGDKKNLELAKNGSGWEITIGEGDNAQQIQILDLLLRENYLLLKLPNETLCFYYTRNSNGSIWLSTHFRDNHLEPIKTTNRGRTNKEEGLLAPMPGIILAHKATEGADVKKGDPLLVMEAMKMEYTINAPHDGILKRFLYAVGAKAPLGSLLAELE